ncbi:GNAT family N-acetyltransferase [Limnobaculum zhutongyuii]|nr:GNAT family N-acetyltransferase [Limnobaculum zhutongyuii]
MFYHIRSMNPSDLDAILDIQASVYSSDILESPEFFENRLELSAETCWVAATPDRLLGYLISYPWIRTFPPSLDGMLNNLPVEADSWFVHDCAISPLAQGLGVGKTLFTSAKENALEQGFQHTSLVSLAQANSYWRSQGYLPVDQTPQLSEKLAAYGENACYMYQEVNRCINDNLS